MPVNDPTAGEIDELDRIYRQGGLKQMALPHIHYHDPFCPHADCGHKMEWIDYQLKLLGDRDGIYGPLVRSWWEGQGFVGQCPNCRQWIRFTTQAMEIPTADQVDQLPHLPENWHTVAQFG
jgi:hypothetical protein